MSEPSSKNTPDVPAPAGSESATSSRGDAVRAGLQKADHVAGRVATVIVGIVYIALGIVAFCFAGAAPITILIGLVLVAYGVYLVSPRPSWKIVIY